MASSINASSRRGLGGHERVGLPPLGSLSIRGSGPDHRRRHGGRRLTRGLAPESTIGQRAADDLDGVLHDRVQREALERHHHAADLIPGERSAIDDEQRERTVCLGVPLDDATEPVRLRELPPVLGLLNVSNAEPLADSLAQELEQVLGVGLEIAENLEPIAASASRFLTSRAYMACPVPTSIDRISNRCRTPSTSVTTMGAMGVLSKSMPRRSANSSLKQR